MRAIRQVLNAKPKNSKFFDHFIKTNGERATVDVGDEEILKYLRSFYIDLSYGNVQQDKYLQYLWADPRIVRIAINDTQQKLMSSYIIVESLKFARGSNLQPTLLEQYEPTFYEAQARYFTYSVLNKGLVDFLNTGDPAHLVAISVQFNNPMNRGMNGATL